ncbi:MAG TPA: DUF3237 domain-containing protein [Acidimicrobiales bacterium]|nr:DUF3237 domain-containing protein [Acidimicrobiales bacterium]
MSETTESPAPGAAPPPITLEPLCRMAVGFGELLDTGAGPHGHRLVVEVGTVEVTGERLSGSKAGNAAADWLTLGPDGARGTVDVRVTIRTDDGALVYVQYRGRIDFVAAQSGTPYFVGVLFETGDERYRWLNGVLGVGRGAARPDLSGLDYDIYIAADAAGEG